MPELVRGLAPTRLKRALSLRGCPNLFGVLFHPLSRFPTSPKNLVERGLRASSKNPVGRGLRASSKNPVGRGLRASPVRTISAIVFTIEKGEYTTL